MSPMVKAEILRCWRELIHEGGCFYVATSEGGRVLPIFPNDSVESSGRTLTYAGTDYAPGQELALGGGVSPRKSDVVKVATIPSGCADDVELWVVSQTG
jgi:hypothetical protein